MAAHRSSTASVGLLHPEGHFTDPKGDALRRATYRRLRRHWHFVNEAKLFEDVHNHVDFGVHVYGAPAPRISVMRQRQVPDTVDGSLVHDGSGAVPG